MCSRVRDSLARGARNAHPSRAKEEPAPRLRRSPGTDTLSQRTQICVFVEVQQPAEEQSMEPVTVKSSQERGVPAEVQQQQSR